MKQLLSKLSLNVFIAMTLGLLFASFAGGCKTTEIETRKDWIESEWEKLQDQWDTEDPEAPPPETPPKGDLFTTDFLVDWPVGPLFHFSPATTDDQRKENFRELAGYSVITPYLFNAGDGDRKHPVNVLDDPARTRKLLAECQSQGLSLWPIAFADDSSSITRPPAAVLIGMVRDAVELYGEDFDGLCLFLEPGEIGNDRKVEDVIRGVSQFWDKPLAIQTDRYEGNDHALRFAEMSEITDVWVQTNSPHNPVDLGRFEGWCRKLKAWGEANSTRVVAFEYSLKRDREKYGDAAIKAGLSGYGNGGSITASDEPVNIPDVKRVKWVGPRSHVNKDKPIDGKITNLHWRSDGELAWTDTRKAWSLIPGISGGVHADIVLEWIDGDTAMRGTPDYARNKPNLHSQSQDVRKNLKGGRRGRFGGDDPHGKFRIRLVGNDYMTGWSEWIEWRQ